MFEKTVSVLSIFVLLLASPASLPRAWKLGSSGLELAPLPVAAVSLAAPKQADLDGDGSVESLELSPDGQAMILSGAKLRWQSPRGWQVRQVSIANLNQDGHPEAVLLVWRKFKPWPVDAWLPHGGRINAFHNQAGFSCHLILIGWYQNAFRERWAGSALVDPVLTFAAADFSGSGRQMLVTLDGSYDAASDQPATRLKLWEWNGFGFTIVSNVSGRFSQIELVRNGAGQVVIITP